MLHSLQQFAVGILILSVIAVTFLAVLSIWDVLEPDVLWKSVSTIGVVAFSSLIVLLALRYLEDRGKSA